jgi:hypothetical protein
MGFKSTKLVLTCVKKALGVDLYPTHAASSSELIGDILLLASGGRGL